MYMNMYIVPAKQPSRDDLRPHDWGLKIPTSSFFLTIPYARSHISLFSKAAALKITKCYVFPMTSKVLEQLTGLNIFKYFPKMN